MVYMKDLDNSYIQIDQNMKEIGKEEEDMDMECELEVMEGVMKVGLYVTFQKDLENFSGQMDYFIKAF